MTDSELQNVIGTDWHGHVEHAQDNEETGHQCRHVRHGVKFPNAKMPTYLNAKMSKCQNASMSNANMPKYQNVKV